MEFTKIYVEILSSDSNTWRSPYEWDWCPGKDTPGLTGQGQMNLLEVSAEQTVTIIREGEKLYAEMVYKSNAIFLFPQIAWVREISICNKIL